MKNKKSELKLIVEAWRNFLNESSINRVYTAIQTLYFNSSKYEEKSYITLSDMGNYIHINYNFVEGIEGEINCDDLANFSSDRFSSEDRTIWQVSYSETDESWGPLLYEICIEYISDVKNGALMADRKQVSPYAEPVWQKYMNRCNSEENLKYIQMDFGEFRDKDCSIKRIGDDYVFKNKEGKTSKINKFTPYVSSDDVMQISTIKNLIKKGYSVSDITGDNSSDGEWIKSPLSKAYYKTSTDVIDKLVKLDLIKIEDIS